MIYLMKLKVLMRNGVSNASDEMFDTNISWEQNLSSHIKQVVSETNDLSVFSRELEKFF